MFQILSKAVINDVVIPNVDFVQDLKSLTFLSLMGTNVLNGDISPAKDIEFVTIDNMRHFNHRWEDAITLNILDV